MRSFLHPTVLRENEKLLHFTSLFTLALHTLAHKHEWRYHFWNGTGGVWWHLAWELSTLIALAIKSVEKGPGACVQNTFGNMLSFVSRTELVAFGWKATAPFPYFQPKGNFISLQFFCFSRTFVIEHSTKVSGQKDSCKTRKAGSKRKSPFQATEQGAILRKYCGQAPALCFFEFVTPLCITNVSL